MEALMYELTKLHLAGFKPVRVLITEEFLEVLVQSYYKDIGVYVDTKSVTLQGLPVLVCTDLTVNFAVAVKPNR